MSGAVFEDSVDSLPCDVLGGLPVPHGQVARRMGGYAAEHQQIRQAPHRVGAAAEAEQEYPVARFVVVQDEFVTIRNVALDAGARHRAEQLLDEAKGSGEGGRPDVGAKTGVVEDHLLGRVDSGICMIARDAVHLVDVAYALLRTGAAVLPGTVREHDDVLAHVSSQSSALQSRDRASVSVETSVVSRLRFAVKRSLTSSSLTLHMSASVPSAAAASHG